MAYDPSAQGALNYFPCRYGTSRLVFRGPPCDTGGPFVAALGGTETYGKFIPTPWPALLSERLGRPVVNLGCMNAGPDAFLNDPPTLAVAARAHCVVVQIMGAVNLSNRHYTVHPRRNDRFLSASPQLRALFRDVDFTEIHFTRHLIATLTAAGPDRFAAVAQDLREAWVVRMKALLSQLPGRKVLLWLADVPPPVVGLTAGPGPVLVDRRMVAALRPLVTQVVTVHATPATRANGIDGMAFGPLEQAAAETVPNPALHGAAAEALANCMTVAA
jgi:hypothetical protein